MRIGAAACAFLGTCCLVLGLVHRFDIAIVATATAVGIVWTASILLNGPFSFHGVFFILMAVSSAFLAGFGVHLPLAAAALSFSICAWDLCVTAPRLASYPAKDRARFARGYLFRSVTWTGAGFLLVLLSHAPRQDSPSLYTLLGLAMLTFVVILFLLWRIRMTFAGESKIDPQESG